MRYSLAMRARLSDIAAQAGVSEATVSPRPQRQARRRAPRRRQAVLTALDVLGYERPARLRKRSAGLVGLVVPELDNPIFPAFAQVIESVLAQPGTPPCCAPSHPGGVTEDEYVEMLLDRQVTGIVFVSGLHADTTADHERYRKLVAAEAADRARQRATSPGVEAPFISCDDRAAAELAVSHLVALGHRRIGLISGPERFVPVQRKLAGFRAAMDATARRPPRPSSSRWSRCPCSAWRAAPPPPAGCSTAASPAIVCGSDLMALGAIRAARARGLARCPATSRWSATTTRR